MQHILVESVHDAELLVRVRAAGGTKVLQEELIAEADRLKALIFEDPLTRLSNRRSILTQLAGLVGGARRHCRALSIAIVDIDHLKAVDDAHGHAADDFGGEEFLALLPDADAAHGALGGPQRPPLVPVCRVL